jgi:hypothetical protein
MAGKPDFIAKTAYTVAAGRVERERRMALRDRPVPGPKRERVG